MLTCNSWVRSWSEGICQNFTGAGIDIGTCIGTDIGTGTGIYMGGTSQDVKAKQNWIFTIYILG